jgi:hypothetical protein
MYKPSTYLAVAYFLIYVPIRETYFLQKWLTRWNQLLTPVEFHPQLSNNGHPVDGALMGAGSLWLWNKVCNALLFNALLLTRNKWLLFPQCHWGEAWSLPIEIDGFHSPTPSADISAVLPCRGEHCVQWDRSADGSTATQVSTVGAPCVLITVFMDHWMIALDW